MARQNQQNMIKVKAHDAIGVITTMIFPRRSIPEVLPEAGDEGGFPVLPKRWMVARTFSWLGRQRRRSRDDESLTRTAKVGISPWSTFVSFSLA